MANQQQLLRTKFFIPPPRPTIIARPRLWQRLDEGLRRGHPFILLSAPAGYGKSTLLADWLRQAQAGDAGSLLHIAWVSLDDDDDEPARFFAYLMAAIQHAEVDWQPIQEALWEISDSLSSDAVTTTLLNEASHQDEDRPLIVVLDDYHKIRSPQIHAAVQFIIEQAPPALRVALITREDPPFTLARWRARDRVTEIRAADLRFRPDEAAAFLNDGMGLGLTEEQLATLGRRTEGWIAGLQLAALALQSCTPTPGTPEAGDEFIRTFAGDHHYVIDYLVEEVLRHQGDEMREFLRQTSILERLNAAVCDALTGRQDSQSILLQMERANLFLIPLDDRRQWYRYHHLMADSLQAGLDEATRAELHRRASAWHEAQGMAAAAVRHATAAGDAKLAADVIERVIQQPSTWSRGDVARLAGWLYQLPYELRSHRPALNLHASRALFLSGRISQAEGFLRQAEASLGHEPRPDQAELVTLATVYRAALDAMRGENLARSATAMGRLLDQPAATGRHTLARAADTLGMALELSGDLAAAEQAYMQAARLAEAAGVHYLAVNARCETALVQIQQGRLTQAAETCRTTLEQAGAERIPPLGLAQAILAEIARERDDLETAARLLPAGIELAARGGIVDDLRTAYQFLIRLRLDQGDVAAALAAWRTADGLVSGYGIPRLASWLAACRARLDLAAGELAAAGDWARGYQAARLSHQVEYAREFEELTLARVLLAQQEAAAALDVLNPLLATTLAGQRRRSAIEAFILQARARETSGDAKADDSLAAALRLAAPEGFARLFLNEGPGLARLLESARPAAAAFVDQLLASWRSSALMQQAQSAPAPPLTEPLSQREIEVLRLLAAGLSNNAIADELVISLGTAKWHVHNIYEKLGVSGRAQAILLAQELQLL